MRWLLSKKRDSQKCRCAMNTTTNSTSQSGLSDNPADVVTPVREPSNCKLVDPRELTFRKVRVYTMDEIATEMDLFPARFGLNPDGTSKHHRTDIPSSSPPGQPLPVPARCGNNNSRLQTIRRNTWTIWKVLDRLWRYEMSSEEWRDLIPDDDQFSMFRDFLESRPNPNNPDSELLKFKFERLGRAVVRALGCDPKSSELDIPQTMQIGSFSGLRMPVILTIQPNKFLFYGAVGQTCAIMRENFILLAPTSEFYNAHCQQMTKLANAAFFDLESYLTLDRCGGFHSSKTAGELFSPFLPKDELPADDQLQKCFALLKQLDTANRGPKAKLTASKVFQHYCLENMSSGEIARHYGCARSVVLRRLQQINEKLGRKASCLRNISSQFERIEARLSDSRARRIHRKSAIDED
jgi:hypothetical protein